MKISYNNRQFRPVQNTQNGETTEETLFVYRQEDNVLTAQYSGGEIKKGQIIGIVDDEGNIDMRYQHISNQGKLMTGTCLSKPEIMPNGKIRLHEKWQWTTGDGSAGNSILEEI